MNKNDAENNALMSFWEHLDVLRKYVVRSLCVVILFSIIAFFCKQWVFDIVLAPQNNLFITYQWIDKISSTFNIPINDNFNVQLINTGLTQQFLIHIKVSLLVGLLCASPYVIFALFEFISPALYENEKKYTFRLLFFAFLLFFVGVLTSYFIVFPFTFRFLGTYQVSENITNLITLESYISTLILLSVCLGILFEMPILAWLLSRMNLINSDLMIKYRRHAIVLILVLAAIITPTTDVFTLSIVFFPIYILYEVSIIIVKYVSSKR